jgi:hypothetical protein
VRSTAHPPIKLSTERTTRNTCHGNDTHTVTTPDSAPIYHRLLRLLIAVARCAGSTSKVDTKPRGYARGGKMEQQGAAGKEAAEQAEQEEEDRGVLFVILGEHQSNLGAAILGNGSGSGSAATALVGGGLSDEPSSPNAFSRPFSDGGGGGTSASASAGGAAEAAVLSPPLAVASPDRCDDSCCRDALLPLIVIVLSLSALSAVGTCR